VADHVEVRRGVYYDSVTLMQISRTVAAAPGVVAAQVAMATELNLEVIQGMGFTIPDGTLPNDLVIAIRAQNDSVDGGLAAMEDALTARSTPVSAADGTNQAPPRPRTLGRAIRTAHATLAVISVPGGNAAVEAFDAIDQGVSVMLFSDNVPVDQEIALKDAARARDVLLMGPDCGTAVIGGVSLGFANVVRRGPIGIVAASGTGAQQVMCLLDAADVGMSHCLGVGGRDLSSAVAGRSTRQALAALATDPATDSILVVSKPPAPEVLAALESTANSLGKQVHWATLGAGRPDLTAAVEAMLIAEGHDVPSWPEWPVDQLPAPSGYLRGLFCGGTLADEAMLVAGDQLGGIRSNIPLQPELALPHDLKADDHLVIDFGDDGMTQGRPHPMIDPSLRIERIHQEAADDACAVLLLDLVLGHGAHADPADELAEAITEAKTAARQRGRELPVVISLTGTAGDPQGLEHCATTLHAAGAAVFLSNARATRHALSLLPRKDA